MTAEDGVRRALLSDTAATLRQVGGVLGDFGLEDQVRPRAVGMLGPRTPRALDGDDLETDVVLDGIDRALDLVRGLAAATSDRGAASNEAAPPVELRDVLVQVGALLRRDGVTPQQLRNASGILYDIELSLVQAYQLLDATGRGAVEAEIYASSETD